MEKPITVAREEYLNSVVELTNGSGLPAFVKVEIINLVLEKLQAVAKKEYERDVAAWRDAQDTESAPEPQGKSDA